MDLGNKQTLKKKKRLEPAPSVLYVVGTPIGNLGDLSSRAIGVLTKVSAIACEDTRHSGRLLKGLGTKASLISFHRSNTMNRIPKLLSLLKNGESIALISDAGLPGISDPGEELISAAQKEKLEVICIPGPSAAMTALVSSGLPCNRFCFEGFLPLKASDRKTRLEAISNETRTTVIYEAPHRLLKLLKELFQHCGPDRPLQVARELTKLNEQQIGPTIEIALQYFLENKPLGEFTLVLGGSHKETSSKFDEVKLLTDMESLINAGVSASEVARQTANKTGLSRKFLYSLLHQKINPKKQVD